VLHLARAFAGMRRKTLLLETDDNGWLRQRLGLPDDVRTAQSVDGSEESLALACLPVSGGFKVLLGAPPEKRDELLRRAASLFDRIVLDAPSGMNFPTGVTGGVFLLPPTRPALRRAERSLREHDAFPWAIVCNRLGSGGALTPSLMSKELGRAVDVGLPCTPALRDVEDRSEFLPIRYRWTRAVMRVAKALDEL